MSIITASPLKAAKPKEDDYPEIRGFIKEHGSFLEAYSRGVEYCTLSKNNEAIHAFTYCKDFISDIFYGSRFQVPMKIYRFSWNPKTNKAPSLYPAKMLIRDKKYKAMAPRAKNCQALLNLAEEALGISVPSRCIGLQDDGCIYVESPGLEWTESLPMISLWTLLMRIGFSRFVASKARGKNFTEALQYLVDFSKDSSARDNSRINCIINNMEKLEDRQFKITFAPYMFEDFSDKDVSFIHNRTGIISVLSAVNLTKTNY